MMYISPMGPFINYVTLVSTLFTPLSLPVTKCYTMLSPPNIIMSHLFTPLPIQQLLCPSKDGRHFMIMQTLLIVINGIIHHGYSGNQFVRCMTMVGLIKL